ncbi:RNA 2',3'-cyclic phosphodiesterase [Halalkalibacter urbisdiaboli]|uniref:RNA 2',3'-cyclic phosphodiesterase n=1 Tax=Halalkalibacter urbisdiaboli TaxID=1960589 RepID=UPI000B43DF21|nr:RNA 2',3'-cyclic phosphodiesterase [Halalkalibacter urbisdiaboli]
MIRPNYFLAIQLPKQLKEELRVFAEQSEELLAFKRWVHYDDLHITLAFLGGCSEEQVEQVITTCKQHAFNEPYHLTVSGFGTFGRPNHPRIFWLGIEKSQQLNRHRQHVFSAMEEIGFSLDQRPFSPHITMARKWNETFPFSANDIPSLQLSEKCWLVEEYVLYKTHMNKRPSYEVVERFPLTGV